MAKAASTARSAWSSSATGAPKSAISPSPRNWFTVPSYRCTASAISRSARSSSSCIPSGSSRSASRVDSAMSTKRTVTCFRSPSRALLEVRILSARCFGVYDSAEATRAAPADSSLTGAPHLLQKRDPAGRSLPHAPQLAPRRAPQPRQKFEAGGFSCWHREHVMPEPPSDRVNKGRRGGPRLAACGSRGQEPRRARYQEPEGFLQLPELEWVKIGRA